MKLRSLTATCAAVITAACGPSGPTWHGDIKPIVDARCAGCHKAGGIAPFSMESLEEARPYAAAMASAVQARQMPPWSAGPSDIPFRGDPTLSQAQIDAFVAWSANDAPEGDKDKPGAPLPPLEGALDRVDLTLQMPEPYTTRQAPDDYRCFPIDWPYDAVKFVTGFGAQPGNPAIDHHVAVYVVPPAHAHLPLQWDAEEEGAGYTCFGGPAGERNSQVPVLLLGAWVPGMQGNAFPDGVGIAVKPGSRLVLQMHYNSPVGGKDQTKLNFRVADQVQRSAVYAPFLKMDWVLGQMPLPPHSTDVSHSVSDDPREFFKLFAPDYDLTNGFDIYSAMFHMHELGKTGEVRLVTGDAARTSFLNIRDWDFHWQREYFLQEPVAFRPGDKISLRCTWDNPTSATVNWGEGTHDEMCVVNMLIAPR